MKKACLGLLLFLFISPICFAQQVTDAASLKQLRMFEDSLKKLGRTVINGREDVERINTNYAMIKTLVSALKINHSFSYPFDSLKSISIIGSADNRFRIISWHVTNSDGSYRYYGTIQMNTPDGSLKLFGLEDYSPLLKNPEDSVVDNHKWYGAQYYKIIQVNAATPYYVLIGWKGNTEKTTKKVIEVLSFKNDKPFFGLPVFDGNGKTRDRIVFEFTAQAAMMLKFDATSNTIIFDHLSPADTKMKGHFDNYGPDMTYSGYRLKLNRWVYVDNLDMRNAPQDNDDQYVDPKKQALIDKQRAQIKN